MKAITNSLCALLIVSLGVFSASADEPTQNRDELRELRSRVQQLQNRIRELEGGAEKLVSDRSSPLAEAVARFNARAAEDEIGRTQPPLTVEEVLAAIRWLGPDDVPVTSEELAEYKKIADTQRLPPDAEFRAATTFIPNGKYKFLAWHIRFRMPRSAKRGWTYAFPIRQRWIASAVLTEAERKALGVGSESGEVHYYHHAAGNLKRSGGDR